MIGFLLLAIIFSMPLTATAETSYSVEYESCMDLSGGATSTMIGCIDAEINEQDKRLNDNYKALMSTLKNDRKEELKKAQRLWIKFRDANCRFYYDPDGGTMHSVLSTDCVLRMTAGRAEELDYLSKLSIPPENMAGKIVSKGYVLSDKNGLNGVNGFTDFPIPKHENYFPGCKVELITSECEEGICQYMILSRNGNEIASISGFEGKVSTIRVKGKEIVSTVEGKIGDGFENFIWASNEKLYKSYCKAGMEYDSGKIICKARTPKGMDSSNIFHVFSGDYQGPDGELPPVGAARNFRIESTIWQKK